MSDATRQKFRAFPRLDRSFEVDGENLIVRSLFGLRFTQVGLKNVTPKQTGNALAPFGIGTVSIVAQDGQPVECKSVMGASRLHRVISNAKSYSIKNNEAEKNIKYDNSVYFDEIAKNNEKINGWKNNSLKIFGLKYKTSDDNRINFDTDFNVSKSEFFFGSGYNKECISENKEYLFIDSVGLIVNSSEFRGSEFEKILNIRGSNISHTSTLNFILGSEDQYGLDEIDFEGCTESIEIKSLVSESKIDKDFEKTKIFVRRSIKFKVPFSLKEIKFNHNKILRLFCSVMKQRSYGIFEIKSYYFDDKNIYLLDGYDRPIILHIKEYGFDYFLQGRMDISRPTHYRGKIEISKRQSTGEFNGLYVEETMPQDILKGDDYKVKKHIQRWFDHPNQNSTKDILTCIEVLNELFKNEHRHE